MVLPVGDEWYALAMDVVREVAQAPVVTPVPTAPAAVIGVWNLRGEIVPLLDTATLLGVETDGGRGLVVVAVSADGLAGFTTTGVPDAVDLGEPTSDGTAPVLSVHDLGSRLVSLLDLDGLVDVIRSA